MVRAAGIDREPQGRLHQETGAHLTALKARAALRRQGGPAGLRGVVLVEGSKIVGAGADLAIPAGRT